MSNGNKSPTKVFTIQGNKKPKSTLSRNSNAKGRRNKLEENQTKYETHKTITIEELIANYKTAHNAYIYLGIKKEPKPDAYKNRKSTGFEL